MGVTTRTRGDALHEWRTCVAQLPPPKAKYTAAVVRRGLMEAVAVCMTPWTAPAPITGPAEQWFVDGAFNAGQWTAALWTPDRGALVWKLPLWVRTHQGAELAAIEAAVRVAAYERLSHIRLVADNMANTRILVLGGRRRGGSVARNTLSAFKMLEDLQLLGRVIAPHMWLHVRAIDRATAHLAAPRVWVAGTDLERLGRYRHHWSWARTFFAVTCAAVYALRVGDVASFSREGIATPKWLTFWD